MKAITLLATLKTQGLSNTETLADFFNGYLKALEVECETVKLVNHNILPGTYSDMGDGDEWPAVLEKIQQAEIIIFATPIWWGNHSSQMQKAIERLDEINDQIMAGKKSVLAGKCGGIIITGDSDGAQHIIGNISNFFNAVGITLPAFCTLSVISEDHAKSSKISRKKLLEKYEKEYGETASKMADGLTCFARQLTSQ